MADILNGATVNFANTSFNTRIRRIQAPETVDKIAVQGAGDPKKKYAAGQSDDDITIEVVGQLVGVSAGQTGALTIGWADNTNTGTLNAAMCYSVEKSGSMNGELLTTYKFCPSA